jgi:hypothetical protein
MEDADGGSREMLYADSEQKEARTCPLCGCPIDEELKGAARKI